VYDEFKRRFVEVAETVAVGDPLDEDTFMGPIIEADQRERVLHYNEIAREEGAEVLVDRGELDAEEIPEGHEGGHWTGPFVYEIDYDPDLRCIHEEVFGPHVALIAYEGGIERAVELQNATPYGLAGSIVSEDYRQINYYRDNAELGLAYGNLPCIGAEVQLPFGGVKKSGNGYPSAREIIEAVTDRTAWTLNNASDIELAQGLSAELKTDDE
jgi:aldehyde dehydrogenase (NAD+)